MQRLASELPGVTVPFETHFFSKGLATIARHGRFPLDREVLHAALTDYCALPALRGSGLRPDTIIERCGGTAATPLALFDAVVDAASGPASTLGEKTPGHLNWVVRLAELRPELRVVGVVRDPRAVAASLNETPWGRAPIELQARRWLDAHTEMARIADRLGDRAIVVRYEDVVGAPDAARSAIGELLEVRPGGTEAVAAPLALDWEHWKAGVERPVTDDRVDRWRETLDDWDAAKLGAICEPVLARFGYTDAVPRAGRRAAARLSTAVRPNRRRRQEGRLAALHREVEQADLGNMPNVVD